MTSEQIILVLATACPLGIILGAAFGFSLGVTKERARWERLIANQADETRTGDDA